jgi:pimeloyl-ACP methyl ester carboxylesterase
VDRPGDARRRRDDGRLGADAPGRAECAAIAGVVCLHGLGRTPADWAAVRPGLEAFGSVACPALPREPARALAAARDAVAAAGDGAVVVGHSMGAVIALRVAAERERAVGAVVLVGCFFPPARNGRPLAASVADYARHRAAFVREARGRTAAPGSRRGGAGALRSLARLGVRPGAFADLADAVRAPVLVVHARDDHHVPLDFALAAAGRRPGWSVRVVARGGHHPHVTDPEGWQRAVVPWLDAV